MASNSAAMRRRAAGSASAVLAGWTSHAGRRAAAARRLWSRPMSGRCAARSAILRGGAARERRAPCSERRRRRCSKAAQRSESNWKVMQKGRCRSVATPRARLRPPARQSRRQIRHAARKAAPTGGREEMDARSAVFLPPRSPESDRSCNSQRWGERRGSARRCGDSVTA
jgi:hypothetical protein